MDATFQNFAERARARMGMTMRMISWVIGGILASVVGVGARERRFALGLAAMRRFFGSVQVLDRPVLGRPQRSPSPDLKASNPSSSLLEGLKAFGSGLGDTLMPPGSLPAHAAAGLCGAHRQGARVAFDR